MPRRDFWYGWTYRAITQTIYLRIDRQPEPEKTEAQPKTDNFTELERMFRDL